MFKNQIRTGQTSAIEIAFCGVKAVLVPELVRDIFGQIGNTQVNLLEL